jgi:hypothetical protein
MKLQFVSGWDCPLKNAIPPGSLGPALTGKEEPVLFKAAFHPIRGKLGSSDKIRSAQA